MVRKLNILCLLAVLLAGCQHDEPSLKEEAPVFAAHTEEFAPATRTTLAADLSSAWSAGDEIAVFQGSPASDRYRLDEDCAGYSSGNFSLVSEGSGGGMAFPVNISVYPYQDGLSCSEIMDKDGAVVGWEVIGFDFPAVQGYKAGSFADDAYAMAAVTSDVSDYNLRFRNAGGALKLQLTGRDMIRKLTLTGNGGEKIAGEAMIAVHRDGSAPDVSMQDGAGTSVVLDCGEGVMLSASEPTGFYFALPPTAFEGGFTVEIESTDGGKGTLATTASNTVGRSQILVMPVAEVEIVPAAVDMNYVDEYGINRGPGILIDGLVWAPVNCGYKAPSGSDKGYPYGKMYQWGRKDGVGYSIAYDTDSCQQEPGGSITIAEANAIDDSNIFYTRKDSNPTAIWFSDATYDQVWNSGTSDDPVKTVNDPCPDGWRVPTLEEMMSLTANRSSFTSADGLNGYWYSGSTAYTAGVPAVFLPAAGSLDHTSLGNMRTSFGRYWTSSLNGKNFYYLSFMSSNSYVAYSTGAVCGYSIRCVSDSGYSGNPDDEIVEVESVALNVSSIDLVQGDTYKLTASVYPSNAVVEGMTWTSGDSSVCTVDADGRVVAVAEGQTVITVSVGSISASCTVNVTRKEDEGGNEGGDPGDDPEDVTWIDYVDEYGVNRGRGIYINDVIWAPVNCGYRPASDSDKGYPYGKLYQWGRNCGVGYATDYDATVAQNKAGGSITIEEANAVAASNIFYTVASGNNMSFWFADTAYDSAWNAGTAQDPVKSQYDPCPEGWRIPTSEEIYALTKNSSAFTSEGGHNGYWYSGDVPYASGVDAVFLPSAGYIDWRGSRRDRGNVGRYWASTTYGTMGMYHISFSNAHNSVAITGPVLGCSIRCVQE